MKTNFFQWRSALFMLFFLLGNPSQGFADWQQPPEQFTNTSGADTLAGGTDGNGNAIAVWTDQNIPAVNSSYFTNGAWGATQTLTSNEAFTSDVAMDASGNAIAIWEEILTGQIRTAIFQNNTWTTLTPDPLDTVTADVASFVAVAMNGSGKAVASWIDTGTSTVKAAFFNGTSWGTVATLGTGSDSITVAYSANGTAVALWNNAGSVTASRYNGTSWSAPVVIGTLGTAPLLALAVGIDAQGVAHAAWTDPAGNVLTSTFNAGAWQPAQTISTTPGSKNVSLAVAPNGIAVLVFIDSLSNGQSSTYNGTTWGPLQPFDLNQNISSLGVSVDSVGNALVVFGTFGTDLVLSSQKPVGGVWTGELQVATALTNIFDITSALSSGGRGFAFWRSGDEGANAFGSALFSNPAAPLSLCGRVIKNNFVTQTDRIHVLSWRAVPDPFVVSYQLTRNGTLIAVIPATGPFVYFDHQRCKHVSDLYVLVAVNGAGLSSPPISIVLP
jgi:hypothetical protein